MNDNTIFPLSILRHGHGARFSLKNKLSRISVSKLYRNLSFIVINHRYGRLKQRRMQDFSGWGGGPNFKISGNLDIHAAMLRAFVRGVWAYAPQEIFFKTVQFRAFRGLFSTTIW